MLAHSECDEFEDKNALENKGLMKGSTVVGYRAGSFEGILRQAW